jgi:hypothetical protein
MNVANGPFLPFTLSPDAAVQVSYCRHSFIMQQLWGQFVGQQTFRTFAAPGPILRIDLQVAASKETKPRNSNMH